MFIDRECSFGAAGRASDPEEDVASFGYADAKESKKSEIAVPVSSFIVLFRFND